MVNKYDKNIEDANFKEINDEKIFNPKDLNSKSYKVMNYIKNNKVKSFLIGGITLALATTAYIGWNNFSGSSDEKKLPSDMKKIENSSGTLPNLNLPPTNKIPDWVAKYNTKTDTTNKGTQTVPIIPIGTDNILKKDSANKLPAISAIPIDSLNKSSQTGIQTPTTPQTSIVDTLKPEILTGYKLNWGKTSALINKPDSAKFDPEFSITKPYKVRGTAKTFEHDNKKYFMFEPNSETFAKKHNYQALGLNILVNGHKVGEGLNFVGKPIYFEMDSTLENAIANHKKIKFQIKALRQVGNDSTFAKDSTFKIVASYINGVIDSVTNISNPVVLTSNPVTTTTTPNTGTHTVVSTSTTRLDSIFNVLDYKIVQGKKTTAKLSLPDSGYFSPGFSTTKQYKVIAPLSIVDTLGMQYIRFDAGSKDFAKEYTFENWGLNLVSGGKVISQSVGKIGSAVYVPIDSALSKAVKEQNLRFQVMALKKEIENKYSTAASYRNGFFKFDNTALKQ